ncbi:uncharacterized protein (DUF1330 family) [Tepidamorphus gemmatus]|uniref:Uncharacterized protein (DUF1330 family) n=1 Tax=Tepidamorphus gemmatus TaxID=747076 RepID=A0A4R3MHU5_9HYPH|nr:DUF1330 domain-containing protein [Tepidamorphus gemmatus]TCT11939.1 uncharacterized protein (DUF1330 family) [Tepidamorphus gemmatus]
MAKGYWVGHVTVKDPDGYRKYQAANGAAFAKYGGRFLVRAGKAESKLGDLKPRHVVIEFPSYQAALDCYHSPEYQHALAVRGDAGEVDLVVVEGYDGEQPS